MATLIQSLSWTLICSLVQGAVIYLSLRLVLRLFSGTAASVRYQLCLCALTILSGWFAATWWGQYQALAHSNSTTHLSVITSAPFQAVAGNIYPAHAAGVQPSWMQWLFVAYIAGLALMLVRLAGGLLQLSFIGRYGTSQPRHDLTTSLVSLQEKLRMKGPVKLLVSMRAKAPMVIGFIKPVILLPATCITQLSADQLETILLHELAHIKRYDFVVNILQTIVETILFFNPFTWLISAAIRHERELCCDDLVMDHTREPLHYATALAALATHSPAASAFTVAATGSPELLFNRIKRIMEMKKSSLSYSRMVAAILIITGIAASIAWLSPTFGPDGRNKQHKPVATLQPVQPVQSAQPVQPTEPVQPVQPVQSVEPVQPVQPVQPLANADPETALIQALEADHLIDEVKGFTVERKDDGLYIDETRLADEVAFKYLSIAKENMRIKVFPFQDRLKMHPDGNLMQIVFPATTKAGCVDRSSAKKKPGC